MISEQSEIKNAMNFVKETLDQGCIFWLEFTTDVLNRFVRILLKDRTSVTWRVAREIICEKQKDCEIVNQIPCAIVSMRFEAAVNWMNRSCVQENRKQCYVNTSRKLDTSWKESYLCRRLEIESPASEERIIVLGTGWPMKRELMMKRLSLRFKPLPPSFILVKRTPPSNVLVCRPQQDAQWIWLRRLTERSRVAQSVHRWITGWAICVWFPAGRASKPDITYPPTIKWVLGAISSEIKWSGHEADHSHSSSAEVKNIWIYTTTPPYTFKTWCLINIDHAIVRRSQWPRSLRHELSSPAQTLGSWARISLKAYMSMCFYSVFVLFCM
jgi:hypothetical protein